MRHLLLVPPLGMLGSLLCIGLYTHPIEVGAGLGITICYVGPLLLWLHLEGRP